MKAWTLLDTAAIEGGGELRLMQRGDEFAINLGRDQLMSTRAHQSEDELARQGCAKLVGAARPSVLIGGLGLGFTLRTALSVLGPGAEVVVAELVKAVVDWARGPLAALHEGSLVDPRVTVHHGNVGAIIRSSRAAFDAILLDVDNGPDGLVRTSNDALYDRAGLQASWTSLRPGGILAVWSAGRDEAFAQRLRKTGFSVEERAIFAHGKKGPRHVIWIATRA